LALQTGKMKSFSRLTDVRCGDNKTAQAPGKGPVR